MSSIIATRNGIMTWFAIARSNVKKIMRGYEELVCCKPEKGRGNILY